MRDEFSPPTGLSALYDEDVYVWSQTQAAAITAAGLAGRLPDDLDWPRLAEEIDALGKSALKAASSLTTRILEHLYLLQSSTASAPRAHWRAEISAFRGDLELELTPTLRRLVEAKLDRLHVIAARTVTEKLAAVQPGAILDPAQRWSLPQILGEADDPLGMSDLRSGGREYEA